MRAMNIIIHHEQSDVQNDLQRDKHKVVNSDQYVVLHHEYHGVPYHECQEVLLCRSPSPCQGEILTLLSSELYQKNKRAN